MQVYVTTDGQEYNVALLPEADRTFLQQAFQWYKEGLPFLEFTNRILGRGSPVWQKREGYASPVDTPLYAILTDLEGRLGVKQGYLAKDWEGGIDPECLAQSG